MALSLQLGYPNVPNSVTNPNTNKNDALDVNGPMSFLTFIKRINVSFEPDSLQEYYNNYLNLWNLKNNSRTLESSAIIVERYRDFLKELVLNYTTLEEKQFLSKIDFTDPYDLDVAMSFYSNKIKELIQFYNEKRNNIKFSLLKNKIIGSNYGTEKNIIELTLSYLKTYDDGKILYDLDSIRKTLEIEIEELYDTTTTYFNQTPDVFKYDNKDLDYGLDIFLKDDSTLIDTIFANASDNLKSIKEADQIFDNKRKLTEKYISTDFYYLSTGNTSTDIISGKLFDNVDNVSNFFNINYPTTASTNIVDNLKLKYDIGFFKPTKTSILLLDGINKSFSFNFDVIQPNSLYYFPDPTISGKNGDILSFIVDVSFLKRNFSSGMAVNQPYSSPNDTKYNGYVSNIDPNSQKYLDSIFDSGFIQDSKHDIYGNLFGLFKNDHRFRQTINVIDNNPLSSMVLNGYTIFDEIFGENYNFNYSTNVETSDPIRSGLYTKTADLSSTNYDVLLYFGRLFEYAEPYYDEVFKITPNITIIEGAYLTKYNLTLYPDPTSSDLSSFDIATGEFYYTSLIEGALHTSNPLQRPLLTPLLCADMTKYIRGSALNVLDGQDFAYVSNDTYDLITSGYAYDTTVFESTILNLSTFEFNEQFELNGNIFVKNTYTKEILPILEAMPYLTIRYNQSIVDELSGNIVKFDISGDIMAIETPTHLIFDKIYFDGTFNDSNTTPLTITHSNTPFDKLSNRYKSGKYLYFCKMTTLGTTISSNNFTLYPSIYQYDTINSTYANIFPKMSDISNLTEFFNVSGNNIRYVSCDPPVLTYSSINNIFDISLLLKDQNNMPCIHEYLFHMNPDVVFTNHNAIKFIDTPISNILNNLSTLNFYLSSSPTFNNLEELVL
jgi:hypothetical protein